MATFTALYKMRIFNFEDVMREMKLSHAGTSTAISRWQSQKVLKPIRRNMYVTIDPSTDAPMCDKFELSSKISESSYVGKALNQLKSNQGKAYGAYKFKV